MVRSRAELNDIDFDELEQNLGRQGKGSNTWGSGRSGVMGYPMGLSHFRGDFSLVAVEDTSPHGP